MSAPITSLEIIRRSYAFAQMTGESDDAFSQRLDELTAAWLKAQDNYAQIAHGDVTEVSMALPGTPWQQMITARSASIAAADIPQSDYHGPDDAAHRAVHNVTEHLLAGHVTSPKARSGLRDALDKADAPATGRAKSDSAIGRATRFGGWSLT